ncbi:MAG TPA: hypothetical protein VG387_18770, partial [Rhizomicrobium sp.]|nr:hypothetical protein [Rhizomicrobium sp.]
MLPTATRRIVYVSLLSAVVIGAAEPAASTSKRCFTVRDSIGMVRIVNSPDNPENPNARGTTATYSPDGSRFVVHTVRGDLQDNSLVETLLLYDTNGVERYLRASAASPQKPTILAELRTRNDWAGLRDIQWIDANRVGFLAEGDNGASQIFLADTRTQRARQLTHSQTNIESYAISGNRLAYFARIVLASPTVQEVNGHPFFELAYYERDPNLAPLDLYTSELTGTVPRKIAGPYRLGPMFRRIWMSPDDHHAVILAPATNAPPVWAEYRYPHYDFLGYTPDKRSGDPTAWSLQSRSRFVLVDLTTGQSRPIVDAPNGLTATGLSLDVFWPKGRNAVILSNTFLPLAGVRGADLKARREAPAVAEVDLRSGVSTPIVWVPVHRESAPSKSTAQRVIRSVSFDSERNVIRVGWQSANGETTFSGFEYKPEHWAQTAVNVQGDFHPVEVYRQEDMNSWPRLMADGLQCHCTKVLYDPTPEFNSINFGRAQ